MKVLFAIIGGIALLPIIIAVVAAVSVAVFGGLIAIFADLFVWALTAVLAVVGIIWLIKFIFRKG